MRIAVISDIHGNAPALEGVLRAIDDESPDAIWCLGDVLGYGPRPNECAIAVRARAEVCLVGNHDLAVLGRLDLEDFTPDAAAAARWSADVLEEPAREWLGSLVPSAVVDGAELFHGSPRDPVWEYVLSEEIAAASLSATSAPLVLVGHSHVPLALYEEPGGVGGGIARDGTVADLGERRWLLNPGSVGQPRDGDPRAAWLLLDTGARTASFRRVEYPIERTQAEIRAAGLPESLAARLGSGA
jgi:diadenosine tetraphosphatase ApaH/serine/threonine PP2A family protein phosphatase